MTERDRGRGGAPPAARPLPAPASRLLLGTSLVLVAVNLRTMMTSLGPVLPEAVRDTGLSPGGAGLLTTLPALCFGLFGPLAPVLARRLGIERALLLALAAAALGMSLRGLPDAAALFGGQILTGAGIGVINVLLPGLVKRDFPRRSALMTGLYTMALCLGAATAAAATVPIERSLGGSWAAALAFWAIPAALAALVWTLRLPAAAGRQGSALVIVKGLWTDALAWQVTIFMGTQASLAYISMAWLAAILRDRGLDPVAAGLILALVMLVQAPAALVVPMLATIGRDQRLSIVAAVTACVVGLMGCMLAPLASVWIWSALLGFSLGSLLALAMMVIVLRAADARVAAELSSMAQGMGYLLASSGPFLAGLLHGLTGGWGATALLVLALGLVAAGSGARAGRALELRPDLRRAGGS